MKPPRSTTGRIFVLAALLATALPLTAAAQGDFGDIRTAIERNAELLAQATEIVRETNSTKARAALETARKLHESSISMMRNGNGMMAGRAAREAREAILRAMGIARQEVKLEENARHAIEGARNRLDRARAALDNAPGETTAAHLVEEAGLQLRRAHDNMQEHMFDTALRLANASRELCDRALQMLRRDDTSPERVRHELNRTDNILARLARIRDGEAQLPEEMRSVLEEATQLQERAHGSARSARLSLALQQTLRSRALALRVLKAAGGGAMDQEAVERAVAFTDRALARARDMNRGANEAAVRERLEEAARVQQQAREHLAAGDLNMAMRRTLQARDMLKDAVRGVDRPVEPDQVRRTLSQTDATLEQLGRRLAERENKDARDLYDRASRRQGEAWDAFESRDLRRALALTKVARDLAQTALKGAAGVDD